MVALVEVSVVEYAEPVTTVSLPLVVRSIYHLQSYTNSKIGNEPGHQVLCSKVVTTALQMDDGAM